MNYQICPIDRYPNPDFPSIPFVEFYRDGPGYDDSKVHCDDGDLNRRGKEGQSLFHLELCTIHFYRFNKSKNGLNRDLNPGPLAPKARIIPLDH